MKESQYNADFPRLEYRDRIGRLREAMPEQGVDAVLFSDDLWLVEE